MTHRLEDQNRRDLNFHVSKVREILPEYMQIEYPTLITFLEKYYDFLESEDSKAFSHAIQDLFVVRDASQAELKYLDLLVAELGNGLTSSAFFSQPRLMTKLLARFYRSKGSLVSAEGFFRGFYNQEVTVEYPKKQVMTINDKDNNFLSHTVGYDSQKFIQNNARFQTFSILLKLGISTEEYETLYKKFVHPAGFYFEGEVVVEGEGTAAPSGTGENPIAPEETAPVTIISSADATATAGVDVLSGIAIVEE